MRRAKPENIQLSRRASAFNRLTASREIDELDAEHWLARWEREAESLGIDRMGASFWREGYDWIAEQRRRK